MTTRRLLALLAPFGLALLLAACTTPTPGPGPGPGPAPGPAPGSVEASLNNLGVDTSPSDRVAADQEALPDDYSPLGSSPAFGDQAEGSNESGQNKTDELFLVGFEIAGGSSNLSLVEKSGVQIDGGGNVDPGTTTLLHTLADTDNGWFDVGSAGGDSDNAQLLRDVTAGDVDNDGLEEIIIVYVDTSSADRVLRIKIIDDLEDGYTEVEDALGDGDTILDVAVVSGDFDGDGAAQIAVGIGRADSAELRFLQESNGDYSFDNSLTKSYGVSFAGTTTVTLELASGNLDYDNPDELGVVINEFFSTDNSLARYFIYDDGNAGFGELKSGPVQGQDGAVITAVVADIDFGDVDGDGIDEVVMGGLGEFRTSCESYDAFAVVYDDLEHQFAMIDTDTFDAFYGSFSNCPAFGPWRLRFLHVNAFDLDGDGIDELHANTRVYEDLSGSSELTLIHELPQEVFVDRDSDAGAYITAATTAITTGDVTGDGRENLILYAQWQPDVHIWGLSAIPAVGFAELSSVEVSSRFNTQDGVGPVLLPVNLDMDSPALKYSDGSYQLVFTEPVVIAALAAAPCADGIGQNLGACATTFGQGTSSTIDAELTVTVKASVHAGVSSKVNVPFVGDVGAEFKESLTLSASLSAGLAYTVEKSRTFTTGPLEDGVVFTTIPYDRYTYTILSHPDPDLVGGTVVISLPREPIILKVDRDFYNANVTGSSLKIGTSVFDHTPGDLASYPSAARKNSLLGQHGGLQNGPISVGQGTGSSGLEIAVSTEVSAGGSLGIEYERSVEVTAGPAMAGFSVGYGAQASLTVTSGTQTTYSVSVGDLDLDAAGFSANQYSYGIFTYVQGLQDQEFEVINFWVE